MSGCLQLAASSHDFNENLEHKAEEKDLKNFEYDQKK
jgi:hypothetical protein